MGFLMPKIEEPDIPAPPPPPNMPKGVLADGFALVNARRRAAAEAARRGRSALKIPLAGAASGAGVALNR